MTPYITFRDIDRDGNLAYFILQRSFPYYVGILSEKPDMKALACVHIPSYSLWIIYSGVLEGNYAPSGVTIEEIKKAFQRMSEWYLVSRIMPNPKKYKKMAINNSSQR